MSEVLTLSVATPSRSYPVVIGADLLTQPALWQQYARASQVAIVTNEVVAPLYLKTVAGALDAIGQPYCVVVLDDGEASKTWSSLARVFDTLLAKRCDRDSVLVALGGGVIGDLTGFAAATYQRGIDFLQVPTTLLAQVDSSVGGKTGINLPAAKNMVGAFHQPRAVFADIATLASLPGRELRAGLAEVVKHGAIADAGLVARLEADTAALLRGDRHALSHAVATSVRIKSAVVAADERESGVRALLNFGHTFGHAIEAGLGFGTWLHGEAVAAGMVLAAELSVAMGTLEAAEARRLIALLDALGLPTAAPDFSPAEWLRLMATDKKAAGGRLRFILLDRLGAARVVPLEDGQIRAFFTNRAESQAA